MAMPIVVRSGASTRAYSFIRGLLAVAALMLGLAAPASAVLPVPGDCQVDTDGANDISGQKDLTQYCLDLGDGSPFELNLLTNLDITTLSGANTADVCALFNTDGDAFVDLAVCVTVDGDGPGNLIVLQEVRLYTCTDTKADSCSGSVLLAGPYTTECEVSQENSDPFPGPAPGPGDDYPTDTQILCGIDLDDFGGLGAGALPRDICSYSSSSPSSSASDCITFATCLVDADCDDGNPCTVDTCDGTGVCVFTPDPGAPCTDDLFCNGEEVCTDLGLCGIGTGTPVDCDDGVSCTTDTCDELGDVCENVPMNSLCSDGEFCTGVETCDPINDCQMGSVPDCDDGITCTTDSCNEGADTCDHAPGDGACDNGLFCDGDETCNASTGCEAGTPPDCGDGVTCTSDSCNEGTDTCDHAPNDGACDNGLFCDGGETCDELLGCQAGTPPSCDDSIPCTTDSCDEAGDDCDHAPDDSVCDNSLFCDGDEVCIAGIGCAVGVAPECSDGVGCTDDSCNEGTDSCDNLPNDGTCDNGLFCDGSETCNASTGCEDGSPPACGDGVDCTIDSCNEDNDNCDHPTSDAFCDNNLFCDGVETCDSVNDCQPGTAPNCDDSIPCTIDSCDEAGNDCDHGPDDSVCDNALFCDGDEVCIAGIGCAVGVAPECGDGVGCTDDSCNEGTDGCDNEPNHASCDNGDFCDGSETCDAVNDCQPGTAPDCDDDVDCTVDSCNEGTDDCDHATSDAFCDNGLFCDGGETCDAVNDCGPGTPPDCADAVGCTTDSCNETTDVCDHIPDNAPCSDGEFCTGVEICDPVNDCGPGTDPCPGAQCDEGADVCAECLVDADCDNSVFCDGVEVCTAGVCEAGTVPDCDDGVACTTDMCNEGTDVCDNTPSNAACDNGLYCDGDETCNASTGCEPGVAPECGDAVPCTVDSCNEGTDTCDNTPNDAACDNGDFCDGAETCDADLGCQDAADPDCDDGVPCTDDACNEGTDGCDNTPDDDACDNGVFCDGAEVCDETTGCEAAAEPLSCDDGIACTGDTCNEGADMCDHAPNDGACDNSLHCDGVETCNASTGCEAGMAPDCGDGVGCTIDTCNETTDNCDNTASDDACDNGLHCDGAETCDEVNDCQAGTAPDCDDGVSCTDDTCNEATDSCDNTPDDDACSNAVFCDGAEICDPVTGCEAAAEPLTCDDSIECTSDSCNENMGACDHAPNDGPCDNGLYCDGAEACTVGVGCEDGVVPDCGDGVDCTVDSCVEEGDSCSHTADNSLCNNGMFCDGVETCNAQTGCVAGSNVACGDAFVCTVDSCNETTDACDHSFANCVCGDSELTGSESCDPPAAAGSYEDCNDTMDNDADGKIDCRDPSCKPGARAAVCDESCSMDLVCARFIRDPARILFNTDGRPDEVYIHGRIPMRNEKLRSTVHAVTFELSNKYGPIYRASLDEGDMRGGIAGKRFRFRDDEAEFLGAGSRRNGLERVAVRTRRFEGVRYLVFTVRAYGDFSKARQRIMTTELSVGTEKGYLTAEWTATPRGWLLHQKNFDQEPAGN